MKLYTIFRPLTGPVIMLLTSLATGAQAETIVFQDFFENDGLATNNGIGGGMVATNTSPSSVSWAFATWLENDNLDLDGGNWGGTSGGAYSSNSFVLPYGFKLEVTYSWGHTDGRFTMGILEAEGATGGTEAFPTAGTLPYMGIAFNPTAHDGQNRYPTAPGLRFSDGSNPIYRLSNDQISDPGMHTLALIVDAKSNWSYSVDGADPTTGTLVDPGWDASRSYRFFVRGQRGTRDFMVQSATLTALPPELVGKSVSAAEVNLDHGPTNLTYTIEVLNTYTTDLGGVVVTDTLPSEVSFLSSTPPPNQTNGNELVYNVGTLPAGTNTFIIVDVLVTSSVPAVITNAAHAFATNTNVSVTAATATAETRLYRPTDLAVWKTVSSVLSNLDYTITVTNLSGVNAEDIVLTDTLPPDTTFVDSMPSADTVSGRDYGFDLGPLAPGGSTSITLSLVYDLPIPGTVTNSATVATASREAALSNNTFTLISLVGQGVDLALSKSVTPTDLLEGASNLTYTLTVENIGTTAATAVAVSDFLPSDVVLVSAVPVPTTTNGNEYVFDLGVVAPGAPTTIVINAVYTSPAVGRTLTNRAVVSVSTQELSLANNEDTAIAEVPDPNVDTDGDGMPDVAEAIAGTEPLDGTSYLWLRIERTGDETVRRLTFPGVTGRTYHVQSRTNLYVLPWVDVQTNIPGPVGANQWMTILRTNPANRVYYRVGVERP